MASSRQQAVPPQRQARLARQQQHKGLTLKLRIWIVPTLLLGCLGSTRVRLVPLSAQQEGEPSTGLSTCFGDDV